MIAVPQCSRLTPEEYLAFEETSQARHEYVDGQIYAMAGGTDDHNAIALNCASILKAHLRGSGCRTFMSDVKTQLDALNIYYYPDVFVTCDERDKENRKLKRYPCLIIEVLSDSTEAIDRGTKFENYQILESLQEYVLINQSRQRVDCFRRAENGLWLLQGYGSGEQVQFQSIGWEGDISDLYEDVDFLPEPPATFGNDESGLAEAP